MFAVYSDPEAMRWVDDGQPIEWPDCLRWIEVTARNYVTRGYGMSALTLRETGATIGFCGIVHPGNQPEPEVKYALLREHWGLGFATEALRGMLAPADQDLELPRVITTIASQNTASQRVVKKAGMAWLKQRRDAHGSAIEVFAWNAAAQAAAEVPAQPGNWSTIMTSESGS